MKPMYAGPFLLLFCSACSYQFGHGSGYGRFVQDPELEWERMAKVIDEEMTHETPAQEANFWRSASAGSSIPVAKKVPEYVIVPASKVQKEVFKPEKGARPLPNSVKEMLLAASATTAEPAARPQLVEILCHVDRLYVRIKREVFKTIEAYKYLKLGTCPVNQGTAEHYYLLYLLTTDCGFKKENTVDERYVSSMLHYKPPGPVLREMPFDIPLQCKFPRFFHSFKVGLYPKLQGGTVFRAPQPKSPFILTPQDASGNEITGAKTYTLGQPMYFEAKQPEGTAKSRDRRMYINKCFITASKESSSSPKHTVIDNLGCMVDGKVTGQSKFLPGASKMVQKFSLGSLIFKHMVSTSPSSQQLYMHCVVSVGKLRPTQSSKACNYDPATKKWKELYSDDSVCACCESTCSSPENKASRNMISSHSWNIDLSSKDGYAKFDPQMKSFDPDTFSLEDPDLAEHEDFLKYWEHDY